MCIHGWVVKEGMVSTYNRILLSQEEGMVSIYSGILFSQEEEISAWETTGRTQRTLSWIK